MLSSAAILSLVKLPSCSSPTISQHGVPQTQAVYARLHTFVLSVPLIFLMHPLPNLWDPAQMSPPTGILAQPPLPCHCFVIQSTGLQRVGHDRAWAQPGECLYVNPNPDASHLFPHLPVQHPFTTFVSLPLSANRFICTIFSRFHIYVLVYDVFLFLTYFTLYARLYVRLRLYKWSNFIPFNGWIKFHCIYAPHWVMD